MIILFDNNSLVPPANANVANPELTAPSLLSNSGPLLFLNQSISMPVLQPKSLVGRLIPILIGSQLVSENLLKAIRLLAVLNPGVLQKEGAAGNQRAIIPQRTEPANVVNLVKTEEQIQVFKIEGGQSNIGEQGNSRDSHFQKQQAPKDSNTDPQSSAAVSENLEKVAFTEEVAPILEDYSPPTEQPMPVATDSSVNAKPGTPSSTATLASNAAQQTKAPNKNGDLSSPSQTARFSSPLEANEKASPPVHEKTQSSAAASKEPIIFSPSPISSAEAPRAESNQSRSEIFMHHDSLPIVEKMKSERSVSDFRQGKEKGLDLPNEKNIESKAFAAHREDSEHGLERRKAEVQPEGVLPSPPQHHKAPSENDLVIPLWLSLATAQELSSKKKEGRGKRVAAQRAAQIVECRFADLLFVILCAALGGCQTLIEHIRFIESREKWFKVVLGEAFNPPSRELLWRVLSTLKTSVFGEALKLWLQELCGRPAILVGGNGKPLLPAISLWETPLGMIFGPATSSDPSLGSYAMARVLYAFDFSAAKIMTVDVDHIDIAQHIEKAGASFIVEMREKASGGVKLTRFLQKVEENPDTQSSYLESYLEGAEHLYLKTIAARPMAREGAEVTTAKVNTFCLVRGELMGRGGVIPIKQLYFSNLPHLDGSFFDLQRLQRPLLNKLGWLLNCELPATSFESAKARCDHNLALFRLFAKQLLIADPTALTVEEKMKNAAKSTRALMAYLR